MIVSIIIWIVALIIFLLNLIREIFVYKDIRSNFYCSNCNTFNGEISRIYKCKKCHKVINNRNSNKYYCNIHYNYGYCNKYIITGGGKMKFTVRRPQQIQGGGIIMMDCALEDINVQQYAILSIDGSTSNSGLAILRESDGALMYSMCATRDDSGETPVHYKIRLKRQVADILRRNKYIQQVYYEEPVVANITSVANLFMLRTFIEEMIIESEPEFDYIKHYEISNMRWKKLFLAPDKVPTGTENQKKAVRNKVELSLPFLNKVTQDEIDAICMGYVTCVHLINGGEAEELESKKKVRPFKYNVNFIGADKDDDMLTEFYDVYNGPEKLLENGISFTEIKGKTDFEKHIYQTMGHDDDKILIIKFSSKHHGNIVLQHKIGQLAAQYDYIYAIVWRVTRK